MRQYTLECSPRTCVIHMSVCYCHLWMSCCVFCMDEMEASITAMSFTSLMHRTHWFENPGRMMGETTVMKSDLSDLVCASVRGSARVTFIVRRLVCRLWCGAAALGVLAAAGRLTAGLPVFSIHLSLRGDTRVCSNHTADKVTVSCQKESLQRVMKRQIWCSLASWEQLQLRILNRDHQ